MDIVDDFKKILMKKDGRTLKWFHQKYLGDTDMTYNAMALQLNRISQNISPELQSAMLKYTADYSRDQKSNRKNN